jgi:hypothetical protein
MFYFYYALSSLMYTVRASFRETCSFPVASRLPVPVVPQHAVGARCSALKARRGGIA